jgi:dihydrodipicolinate synthase/N-acetylneuraminate lyase
MKTSPITVEDLRRSVLSVPPLARRADLALDEGQNARIVGHLRDGGVSTFMYGGNANLYHMGVSEFGELLDMLQRVAAPGDWMIPSVGSDFGKAMDQVALAKGQPFPTVMVLPHRFPVTTKGIATGLRRLADAYGRAIIAYVKDHDYVDAADLGRLVQDGAVVAVKYGTVRESPADDAYLGAIVDAVGADRVISGIGERPAIVHWTRFGLRAFTSGAVCIAPALSTAILRALQAGDMATAESVRAQFLPFEDLRDAHSPLRVLHEGVRLAGIAETGPMLPLLANIDDERLLAEIGRAAVALLHANGGAAAKAA